MASGETIRNYVGATIKKYQLDRLINYNHRLLEADWSEVEKVWHLSLDTPKGPQKWTSRFLWLCTGYYDYHQGHNPDIPGLSDFNGPVIHPQHWPEELVYENKRIVVIGSGATAVTLVPALAKLADRVTMLQRSPSYVSEVPTIDPWARILKAILPRTLALYLLRWKGVLYQTFVFKLARRFPKFLRKLLLKPWRENFSDTFAEEHFSPTYNPWQQRLCVDADGEFMQSLKSGRAEVVTDTIKTCTAEGVVLQSGKLLEADIIVTATGLNLQMFGGAKIQLNGETMVPNQHLVYKGLMFSDVPNLALSLGYTNMSWTLKCDLIARYMCRLLKFMKEGKFLTCRPVLDVAEVSEEQLIDFTSGYFERARHLLPKQGSKAPWKLHQSYIHDLLQTSFAPLDDGTLKFES